MYIIKVFEGYVKKYSFITGDVECTRDIKEATVYSDATVKFFQERIHCIVIPVKN